MNIEFEFRISDEASQQGPIRNNIELPEYRIPKRRAWCDSIFYSQLLVRFEPFEHSNLGFVSNFELCASDFQLACKGR